MREYEARAIRNVAVVGHGASGKTSLVDAMAWAAGASKRHGAVKDGTSLTDFTPEETERGFSITLGCAYAEWEGFKINLLEPAQSAGFVARGRVLRPGRTLSVCRADVVTADPGERLVATMMSTIIIRPLRRP